MESKEIRQRKDTIEDIKFHEQTLMGFDIRHQTHVERMIKNGLVQKGMEQFSIRQKERDTETQRERERDRLPKRNQASNKRKKLLDSEIGRLVFL